MLSFLFGGIMSSQRKYSKNLIYTVAFVLITLLSLFYKTILTGTIDKPITMETLASETSDFEMETAFISETTLDLISVYICGEVTNPGVYEINRGSIVNDVVNMAGGLTPNAACNRINLVYIIDSNISIYIPSESEDYTSEIVWGNTTTENNSSSLININSGTIDELMLLPGIGQSTANAIIEYRQSNPFIRIEDIMNVPGIGEAKFNAIKDFICV